MARGAIAIGDWPYPGAMGGGVAIPKPTSAAKIDKKESDGQDDGRTTFKGKKVGEIEIEFRWEDTKGDPTGVNFYTTAMLADISPRGPKAGKSFEWVDDDQDIHKAYSIVVETLKGPIRPPGSGEATATLSCSTWVKPKPAQPVAKTPDKAEPWGTKPGVATFTRTLPGFAKTPPKVKP
jgi:hypothetical protein